MSRPTTRSQRERTVIRTARAVQRRKRKADGTATGAVESPERVLETVEQVARGDAPWFRVLLIVGGVATALLLTRQAYDYFVDVGRPGLRSNDLSSAAASVVMLAIITCAWVFLARRGAGRTR